MMFLLFISIAIPALVSLLRGGPMLAQALCCVLMLLGLLAGETGWTLVLWCAALLYALLPTR